MEVVNIKIKDLKPAEYNPRQMTAEQHDNLKKSIEEFGFVDPLIVNKHKGRENVVIGGHQRLKIAQELEMTEVPVVYVDLEPEREKELNLRLNRNTGEWDWDELANNFDNDFLLNVGFTEVELGIEEEKDDDDFDAEGKAAEIEKPESTPGTIYELGTHRLMCGDATNAEHVKQLMNGKKADLVFTDPPYDIEANRKDDKKFGGSQKGDYDLIEFPEFHNWIPHAKEHSTDTAPLLVFEHWRNTKKLWLVMEKLGYTIKNVVIWYATNRFNAWSTGNFFNVYDILMCGAKGKSMPLRKERAANVKDVIEASVSTKKSAGQDKVLGTKPLEVLTPYINCLTDEDDLVFDPFGGSGSTMIACQQINRHCYLMEINPVFADVIVKRWEEKTGLKAKKLVG